MPFLSWLSKAGHGFPLPREIRVSWALQEDAAELPDARRGRKSGRIGQSTCQGGCTLHIAEMVLQVIRVVSIRAQQSTYPPSPKQQSQREHLSALLQPAIFRLTYSALANGRSS